jgi:GT2 family glycosyltransferase
MPFLHIIVLGYGRFRSTSQLCLESLLPLPEDVELTILDNGSPDNSADQQRFFLKDYPQVRSIISAVNLGFSGGMNHAVSQMETPAEWILLVGSDTEFHPDALLKLLLAMKTASANTGIIGPMTNFAGNAQGIIWLGSTREQVFENWSYLPRLETPIISPLYRADFFCVGIRKKLWEELGGLDLSYGRGYYEDFDFCMRAKAINYECVMVEDALVFHQGSASFKNDPAQSQLIKINKKIFVGKFPKAELRHRRLDQYLSLKHYLHQSFAFDQKSFISSLIHMRLKSLEIDLPRSPFKKLFWKIRIKKITKQLEALFH